MSVLKAWLSGHFFDGDCLFAKTWGLLAILRGLLANLEGLFAGFGSLFAKS
ncbi:hypothetical protein [Ureibacillus acetophenoni]|uniref:hypothetical protein n=1 Tax=Ureibacillus acetophenoni TaxID=614649 RepID=UPI0014825D9E|nr:hypothetical protein [Ureibacillus acetophenoni]